MKKLFLKEVNSTNDYAKKHFGELEDKTIIYTDFQTNGHGRLGNSWLSSEKTNLPDLYMSLILKPPKTAYRFYPNFTQYVSIVICELLDYYNVISEIKWPNDILISGKKIAGILAEKTSTMDGFVIGVGINLNRDKSEILKIDKPATSLNLEINKDVNRDEILDLFIEKFLENYQNFIEQGFPSISNKYKSRVKFIGKELVIRTGRNEKIIGIAKNITEQGELIVNTKEDEEQIIISGEIL